MADIESVKLPNGSSYNIKDNTNHPQTLSTPINIGGTDKTTVEDTLNALAGMQIYSKGVTLTYSANGVATVTSDMLGDEAGLDFIILSVQGVAGNWNISHNTGNTGGVYQWSVSGPASTTEVVRINYFLEP